MARPLVPDELWETVEPLCRRIKPGQESAADLRWTIASA